MQIVPLHVIHLDQDDPKKCTSRKLHQSGLVNLHESANSAPRRGYLLDPRATTVLAPEDGGLISLGGSCLLYTSPSPRDAHESRMPSSA